MDDYEEIDDANLKFYSITDLEEYCRNTRLTVGNDFGDNITDKELDDYISMGQVEKIVDEFCEDYDESGSPIISEESHSEICEAILTRIQNVGLAKLASDDTLQVAFDEKLNDFVFWTT